MPLGTVTEVGAKVQGLAVGDKVQAFSAEAGMNTAYMTRSLGLLGETRRKRGIKNL